MSRSKLTDEGVRKVRERGGLPRRETFAKLSLIESIFNDGSKTFRIAAEMPFQRQVLFIFGYTSWQHYFAEKIPL